MYQDLFHISEYVLFWWIDHVHLIKMCILPLLVRLSYQCLLVQIGWSFCLSPLCPYVFCLFVPSVRKGVMLIMSCVLWNFVIRGIHVWMNLAAFIFTEMDWLFKGLKASEVLSCKKTDLLKSSNIMGKNLGLRSGCRFKFRFPVQKPRALSTKLKMREGGNSQWWSVYNRPKIVLGAFIFT